jgi:DNA-binding transcriptional MerR regulator
MDEPLMKIGEIAAFFNVTVKAMRVYEKVGIINPIKIDKKTGYRYYSADQVKLLDALLELRNLGFSLSEIKVLLESEMLKERYMEVLVHKKIMWQDRLSKAQDKIDSIEEIIESLAHSKPPIKLHELTEDERAHLLSRMVCIEDLHAKSVISEAIWL